MKLNIKSRSAHKGENKRFRRNGLIPAIVYGQKMDALPCLVEKEQFDAVLRHVTKGRLSTVQFSLVDEQGKEHKVIIKDIQRHRTTYDVLHLDFCLLDAKKKININIPIECTGVIDCVGIKLGGVLRQVIRKLPVSCLPKDIPEYLTIDVKDLEQKQSRRLKDLNIPEGVRPCMDINEVAVVIAKR